MDLDWVALYELVRGEVESQRTAALPGFIVAVAVVVVALVAIISALRSERPRRQKVFRVFCLVAFALAGAAAFGGGALETWGDPYVVSGRIERRTLDGPRKQAQITVDVEAVRVLSKDGLGATHDGWGANDGVYRANQELYEDLVGYEGAECLFICLPTDECVKLVSCTQSVAQPKTRNPVLPTTTLD